MRLCQRQAMKARLHSLERIAKQALEHADALERNVANLREQLGKAHATIAALQGAQPK
jgi:hypothetical protein